MPEFKNCGLFVLKVTLFVLGVTAVGIATEAQTVDEVFTGEARPTTTPTATSWSCQTS